jgi:hypothetical protein
MRKTVIAGFILLFLIWWWLLRTAPQHDMAVCPNGYYLIPGPNSFGGNPRRCVPIGEQSSEDAIPAVNYSPPLDYNVIQAL